MAFRYLCRFRNLARILTDTDALANQGLRVHGIISGHIPREPKKIDLLVKERLALISGGLDADLMTAETAHALEEARAAGTNQESLKRQLKTSTILAEEKSKRAYVVGSSALDMAINAISKDSPAAKNFQRIRRRVRREKQGLDTTVQPAPIPTPQPMK